MLSPRYEEAYVKELFDRMCRTYDAVNLLSSLGFSKRWREVCVANARVQPGQIVCDMMSGAGECWEYVLAHKASLVSVDFSPQMIMRQSQRQNLCRGQVEVRCENALATTIGANSVDRVIGAFGLKTLGEEGLCAFAKEIHRILKPGGRLSLIEISTAEKWVLGPLFRWYVNRAIPWIGRLLLGDIECYQMLGVYTQDFGSCHRHAHAFTSAGLQASVVDHFYGCATSIVGAKLA